MSEQKGYYDNKGNWVEPKRELWRELVPYAITNALSMTIACALLDGITFTSFGSVVFAAILLTIINWGLKPFIHMISLPLSLATFGIFALIINGIFLGLVAWLIPGFGIASFGTAVLGSIIITVCNLIIRLILPN